MIIKQVRLSQQAKDQLSRLKAKTGIKNWNILCRWALTYSLSENTVPTEALVKAWCLKMGLPIDEDTVSKYFRLNLERGISHLCGTGFIKSVDDLLGLAVNKR